MTVDPGRPVPLACAALIGALLSFPCAATSQAAAAPEVRHSTIPVGSVSPGARPWQPSISRDGQYVVYQTDLGVGWRLYLQRIDGSAEAHSGLG